MQALEGRPEAMPDAARDGAVVRVGEDEVGAFPAQFQRDAL